MIHIISLESTWMNSKVFTMDLKRVLLNYVTDSPVQSVLNNSQGVIDPASIIKENTSQYTVSRFMIVARGLFLIRLSFCDVFFPKDIPTCFGFALIPNCAV